MAQAVIDRPPSAAAAYIPFSPRLAPSLIATGALFAIAGGLGLWVRVTSVDASGIAHQTSRLTGAGGSFGCNASRTPAFSATGTTAFRK